MDLTLGAVVEATVSTLAELVKDKAASVLGLEEELERLNWRMNFVQGILADAESRCLVDSTVTAWLSQLRDFMYCAEDVIESCKFEGQKILEHPNSVVRGFLSVSSWFQNARFRHRMRGEIRRLDERLADLCNDKVVSLFQYIKPEFGNVNVEYSRRSCPLIEPDIVGKEIECATDDLREIILRDKEPRIRAYAIVGMGGIGKTTLAQKVYNDSKIKINVHNLIWVCISQNYSEIDLLNQIIRNLGVNSSMQGETIGELQCRLANAIKQKSFLLVLDDVWRSDVWTNLLKTPLQAAASGIVVITTRDKNVALSLPVVYIHEVKLMSKDSGFELLCKSMNTNKEEMQGLEDVGYLIVKKCGYLPLAIRAIGGLLAPRGKNRREWERVLRSDAWSVGDLPDELKGALYLSYRDLPSHLKQCFLFCSLYPEDSLLRRQDLIRSWIAQGFVREQKGLNLEDVAEGYYSELIHRSFLQLSPIYTGNEWCTMHDLLRSLGLYLSRNESFCGDPLCMDMTNLVKLKHLSVVSKEEVINLRSSDGKHFHLRTFFLLDGPSIINSTFFPQLPYLRDLTLNSREIDSIPDSVGDLSLLRVLNLKHTSISSLPESICSLKNLQVLNLENCALLRALPKGLTRLCNMRCLALEETPLIEVPKRIGLLKFLNDISSFLVAGECDSSEMQDGWSLSELQHLMQLRRLQIYKLEREVTDDGALVLTDKSNLKFLSLVCTPQAEEGDKKPYSNEASSRIERTFEKLSPPIYLEELVISNFFGFHFPSWMGSSFPHLKAVIISDCIAMSHLPPLGQLPNLRYLRIERASVIVTMAAEFLGDQVAVFPKLETLIIEEMPNLVEWSLTHGGEILPNLKNLTIIDCPNLKALPEELNGAKNLQELLIERAHSIKEVRNFPCLSQWLQIEECDALETISNISSLRHLNVIWCPALRCVENLDQLRVLGLTDDLINSTPAWVSDLMKNTSHVEDEKLEISWLPVE